MRGMSRLAAAGLLSLALGVALGGCDCGGDLSGDRDGGYRLRDTNDRADRTVIAYDGDTGGCGTLVAAIRDFRADHPDFEDYLGSLRGIVQADLGRDRLPIYAPDGPTEVTTGRMEFDQWYRDVPGANIRFMVPIPLAETSPGTYVFDDSDFFPLDGIGWGEEIDGHNFHFTTEIHSSFTYRGGEVFTFRGDDDVWVFVNHRLALDLGGVHGAEMGTVDFDAQAVDLGITVGFTYDFDVFHAERHTVESNFRIETSIDCFGPI
jgi:fibro-slime domain-containing protein